MAVKRIVTLEIRSKTSSLGNLGLKFVSGEVTFFGDSRLFGRASSITLLLVLQRPCGASRETFAFQRGATGPCSVVT